MISSTSLEPLAWSLKGVLGLSVALMPHYSHCAQKSSWACGPFQKKNGIVFFTSWIWPQWYMFVFLNWGFWILQKRNQKCWLFLKWYKTKIKREMAGVTWLSYTLGESLCVFTCSRISFLVMALCCRGDIGIAMAMSIDAWNPPVWYSSNYLSVLGRLEVGTSWETDRCSQKKGKWVCRWKWGVIAGRTARL